MAVAVASAMAARPSVPPSATARAMAWPYAKRVVSPPRWMASHTAGTNEGSVLRCLAKVNAWDMEREKPSVYPLLTAKSAERRSSPAPMSGRRTLASTTASPTALEAPPPAAALAIARAAASPRPLP
jgi:hypothetical protein